jgi:dolichyl-diphosphooligosaccharide--protein glycosyltransferase
MKNKTAKRKPEPKPWLTRKREIIILAIIIAVAVIIRTVPQWDTIFQNGQVLYRGVDSWYHMRLVDAMVHNFPKPLLWDYYTIFPSGMDTGYRPLLTWIVSAPAQFGINYATWGAVMPVVAGAGATVVIYLLTRELLPKYRFAPIIASILAIMLPSEFLHRSLLGFTDHHVLEVLFTTLTIYFLVLSFKRNWKFSIGAGVSLGLLSLA